MIIKARRAILHSEAGYIYADCRFAPTSNLLQSGGGPYIIATTIAPKSARGMKTGD